MSLLTCTVGTFADFFFAGVFTTVAVIVVVFIFAVRR
jgi:hypothetical protein